MLAAALLCAPDNLGAQPPDATGRDAANACSATPVHWQPRRNIGTRAGLVIPWGVVIFTHGCTPEAGATSLI